MDNNNGSSFGSLNRVLGPEEDGQLLQSTLACLNEEEVDDEKFKNVPEDKQEVVFPSGVGKSDAGDEGVVE